MTDGMTDPYDPAREGAQMSFDGRLSYGDYLHLDLILGAQSPLSRADDELLFIIQHQTSELWMKLALHELHAAREDLSKLNSEDLSKLNSEDLSKPDIRPAFKRLSRTARIFEQLSGAWDVLRTMTPSDYTRFRESLGQSSGFQSYQYREIEFLLGNRNTAMLRPHAHRPGIMARLEAELEHPSLYDAAVACLARSVPLPADSLRRDRTKPHAANAALKAAWREVYTTPQDHWDLYELAEKLVDLEDHLRRWRFNHVTTVERVIGLKRGTGGTSGAAYLRRMLDVSLFPDLWELRTEL